jgi:nitronate monooxygenase
MEADDSLDYETHSAMGLRDIIGKAKKLTDKPLGVNIMCALSNYESLVRVSVEEGIKVIISGAGLPMKLPQMVDDDSVKLVPIVSSGRTAGLIFKTWLRRYNRLPDAVVVEGPLAGGHLGFSLKELADIESFRLEKLVTDVLAVVREYEESQGVRIPVIAAGGIYGGADIARFLRLGAGGVQMGTRFVCTHECDAADEFKQTYLDCREGDVVIIDSPVGLPARVIRNEFVRKLLEGEHVSFGCYHKCLITCNPTAANYCIAEALVAGYRGQLDDGYAMAGANAWRINEIVSVKELMDELVSETRDALAEERLPG